MEKGNANLEKKLEAMEKGNANLEKKLEAMEKGNANLEKGNANLEKGNANLEKKLEAMEKGNANLEKKLEAMEPMASISIDPWISMPAKRGHRPPPGPTAGFRQNPAVGLAGLSWPWTPKT